MDRKKLSKEDQEEHEAWCEELDFEGRKAYYKKLRGLAFNSCGANIGCRREKVLMGNKQFHVLGPASRVYTQSHKAGHNYIKECKVSGTLQQDGGSVKVEDAWIPVVKFWRTV